MTATETPDLFSGTQLATAAAQAAFERTLHDHMPNPTAGSTAAADFRFPDETWIPNGGRAPLAVTTLLLSGAVSVLTDLGDLVGSARGPVTAPILVRYVVEHVAEINWLLSPGTYTLDDGDPTAGLSNAALDRIFREAQQVRIRRAALRSYGWTIEFENGRLKPVSGGARPASLPANPPDRLERILEPHGLWPTQGAKPPSQLDAAKKAKTFTWQLDPSRIRPPLAPGPPVRDESTTKKVNALVARYMAEGGPGQAEVYAFLSTSTHPNPFAISEVGGSGLFQRTASEMARLVTVALGAFACGLELVNGYAGWNLNDVHAVHDLIRSLRDDADAWDEVHLAE